MNLIQRAALAATGAAVALSGVGATPALAAVSELGQGVSASADIARSGEYKSIKLGKCRASGRYVNGFSYNLGQSDSSTGCWNWVKIWVYDYKTKRKFTAKAQGGGYADHVTPLYRPRQTDAKGRKIGTIITQLQVGVCVTSSKCTSKTWKSAAKI